MPDATQRFFTNESALFLGPLPRARVHSHHAIQGCVALQGPLRCGVGQQEPISAVGVLIGSDVPHEVSAPGLVAHFYALPESPAGSRIVAALSGRPVMTLAESAVAEVRGVLLASRTDERLFPQCLETLMKLAQRGARGETPKDPRVVAVLDSLASRSPDAPLADLAREVGLSPDRLRHLIRDQVGIPLRSYRRWARLVLAIGVLQESGTVTAAAAAAGFADSAHLSRAFREAFTFPPSVFLRDSRFVQARRDPSA